MIIILNIIVTISDKFIAMKMENLVENNNKYYKIDKKKNAQHLFEQPIQKEYINSNNMYINATIN